MAASRSARAAKRWLPCAALGLAAAPFAPPGLIGCEERTRRSGDPDSWGKALTPAENSVVAPEHKWSQKARDLTTGFENEYRGEQSLLQRLGLVSSLEPEVSVHRRIQNRIQNLLQVVSPAAPNETLLDYWIVVDKKKMLLRGVMYFSTYAEGPPGAAHGGISAAMVDQMMGICIIAQKGPCVTLRLEVNYKKFIPSGEEVVVECWVESSDRRKHNLKGRIKSLDGSVVYVECSSLFLELKKKDAPITE
eukprot:TRINITY_DN40318_c0_g1_i1.p1 TRINITY_DN40318_c0_g1~~TRINITY_DN40318_c0_g1_i1.p1  ORF type:complete len:260 (+),score=53.61 TRINITY_DN40318_c0_g1_i1:36-782(+)